MMSPMSIEQARSVTGEATYLDELPPWENCGDGMARRQPHNVLLPTIKKGIGVHDEGVGASLDEHCKSRFQVGVDRGATCAA
jgi:hypothetical protein